MWTPFAGPSAGVWSKVSLPGSEPTVQRGAQPEAFSTGGAAQLQPNLHRHQRATARRPSKVLQTRAHCAAVVAGPLPPRLPGLQLPHLPQCPPPPLPELRPDLRGRATHPLPFGSLFKPACRPPQQAHIWTPQLPPPPAASPLLWLREARHFSQAPVQIQLLREVLRLLKVCIIFQSCISYGLASPVALPLPLPLPLSRHTSRPPLWS